MNKNDINLIKESMVEYSEGIFGICIGYMKKNNIDFYLSGNDKLSKLLIEVRDIQDKIMSLDDYDELISYKERLVVLNNQVRDVIR